MSLLPPVLLLLLVLSGGFGKVVNDFTQTCPAFFANPRGVRSPPTVFTGPNYKQICQIRSNIVSYDYKYATLYDTHNKIPVYSAYRFEGFGNCSRNTPWYIEPQLEGTNKDPWMDTESRVSQIQNQAINKDYEGTYKHGYDKGHLAPVRHASSQSCADASFTLTNAAPQDFSFNRGQWKKLEKDMADTLEDKCKGYSRYIVTGVVPDYNKPPLKNRVRIPSHFWTAYCCLDNNLRVKASSGFIGINENEPVQEMTVRALEGQLTNLYNKGTFQVFGGSCNEVSFTFNRYGSGGSQWEPETVCDRYQSMRQKRRCIREYRKRIRSKHVLVEQEW